MAIKFVDIIPSTNCAEWKCDECWMYIVSSGRPEKCLRCAVLSAAKEWGKAEEAWEHCRLVQGAGDVRPIIEQRKIATAALRSAVDELRRARGEKEGE